MIKDILIRAIVIFALLSGGYVTGAYLGFWEGLASGYREVQERTVEF